jgi:hypothetical protein
MVAARQQLAATAESQARATTGRASVPAGSVGAVAAAEQAAAQLAGLRERADTGQFGLTDTYRGYLDVQPASGCAARGRRRQLGGGPGPPPTGRPGTCR